MNGKVSPLRRFLDRYSHINWALADQSMVSGANFLTGLMLARFLGIEEFGRFTLAWMAVLFVNSIQNAMIVSPMMSIGPKQNPDDKAAYFGAVAAQQLVFGGVAFVIVWSGTSAAATLFPDWGIDSMALPLAFTTLAFQIQEFMRRYFFTLGRGTAAFASDAFRYLGQVLLLFWLFATAPMDSASTLWVIAVMAMLAGLVTVPALGGLSWQSGRFGSVTRRHWLFSRWLVGSALMQWTSSQFLLVAAGAMLGAGPVGALRAAQNLMGVTRVLFLGLENVAPVRAAAHYQSGGRDALLKYLRRLGLAGELATAAIAGLAAAAPEFWLNLVFGPEYQGLGYLLQWFAAIQLLHFITIPLQAGLRSTENTRAIFMASMGRTVVALLSFYPLIHIFGIAGVMIGLSLLTAIGVLILIRHFAAWVRSSQTDPSRM